MDAILETLLGRYGSRLDDPPQPIAATFAYALQRLEDAGLVDGLDEETKTHLNKELRVRLQEDGKGEHDGLEAAVRDVAAARAEGKPTGVGVRLGAKTTRRSSAWG